MHRKHGNSLSPSVRFCDSADPLYQQSVTQAGRTFEIAAGGTRIAVTAPTRAALLAEVGRRFAAGEGFALATLNLDHLVKLQHDAAFRAAYAAQDLVTADGNPVVWLARLAGRQVDLIPGSDLILPLVRQAAAAGVKVGLFGATEAALSGATAHLQAEVPGLEIALALAPPMGFDPEGEAAAAAIAALRSAGVGLCLVALGAPKQERFAAFGRRLAPEIGFAGIGAGLDFLAGTQRRAPAWVRAVAMEWLWRMLSDPGRLAGRYARCAAILPGHMIRAWRQRD